MATSKQSDPANGAQIVTAERMIQLLKSNIDLDKNKPIETDLSAIKEEKQEKEEEIHFSQDISNLNPPTIEVRFQFSNIGLLIQKYHDVIILERYIVLIKDINWTYGPYYIPPISKNTEDTFTLYIYNKKYEVIYTGLYIPLKKYKIELLIFFIAKISNI